MQNTSVPSPANITDLIENIDSYVAMMRGAKDTETIPKDLKQYAWEYFRSQELNKDLLQKLAIFVSDKTYRIIAELGIKDKYTWAYFAKVIPYLWDTLQDRGVDIFFIIDNELREDRFNLTVELFELTGAAVVTPYSEKGTLSFEVVEARIKKYMAPIRNIIYIEKNDSVNYIEQVKELATKSDYLVLFRNQAPIDGKLELLS